MTWISQVILLLVASSTAYAVLQMSSTCDSYKYGGNCTVKCINFKGQGHEMYYNNKKVVNGDTYDVSVQFNIQLMVKMKLTMDTAGEYSCKAPGMTTAKAVVRMDVEAKAPKAMYYLLIGSKATVDTTVYGYPKPATYTYKKKSGDGTYQTVAQYNTKTKSMDVGIGKYEISDQNAHLTVTKVVVSDGGDYQVTDGGTSTASFKIEAGSPPKIKTKPAPSYDVVSGVAATFKCEFESLDKLTVVTWVYTAKGVPSRTITNTSTGAVTLDGTNLKITPVVANKDDSFKCVGSSVFGKDEASTVIGNVYTKPAIKAMTNLKIDVGSKKDISCEATGGPNLAISWMKRGKDGKFTELTGQAKTPGKSVYSIASAKLADRGDYKCTAVITPKPELKDEAIVSVDVLTSPVFDTVKSTSSLRYIVGKGMKQTLTCIASGNPAPTVKFMKGKVELSGAVVNKTGMSVKMTLLYTANATADGGKVTCVAKNSVKEVVHDIIISVIDKLSPPTGLKYAKLLSTSLELQWDAVTGATDYSVYQDGSMVKKSSSNMAKIDTLTKGTTYKFAVSVNNEAGEGKKSDEISVTTPSFEKPSNPLPDPKKGPPKSFAKPDVTFSWLKPANDGGDAKLEYEVKYCQQDKGAYPTALCKTAKTMKTSITISGLKEKTMYQFSVNAKNRQGAGKAWSFEARTGAKTAPPRKPKPTSAPKAGGLSGGAIAGIIIAVILIVIILIDLFCCYFNDCGFTHCCYSACCAGKGKGNYNAADSKDAEKAELKEVPSHADDMPKTETKTAPEEKEDLIKEKKTEDV
eukprot:Seg15.5 transcript_id=Seg15.5/GoldUCD/mRNA.D3Y31 product="Neural cell adhesion molecule 2" protein_id=Seg15.5/GoldUCD/D3Y31